MSDRLAVAPQTGQAGVDLAAVLAGMTLNDADSTRFGATAQLFRCPKFRLWYDRVKKNRPVAAETSDTPITDTPAAPWSGPKPYKDSLNLARWFHAYLVDNVDKLEQASDRDAAGRIFQEFYRSVMAETMLEPLQGMEPLVMTRLRGLALLKSQRINSHTVLMTFADAHGMFPKTELRQTARERIQQAKKDSEANKDHVIVSDAPASMFVPLKQEHCVELQVGIDEFAMNIEPETKDYVLEDATLAGPNSNRYRIKEAPELPTDLATKQKILIAVTPVAIGVVRAHLTLSFRKPSGETFVIVRYFSFRSGDETLDKILAPLATYKRKKVIARKHPLPPKKVHGPPPPPQKGKNPLQGKLKPYYIPNDVTDLLIANEFTNVVTRPEGVQDYARFWHHLLWACEHQDMKDIQWYDMDGVQLEKEGRLFRLRVPGLAESRPSVLRGDLIEVTWKDNLYLGRVVQTRQLDVLLQLATSFQKKFNTSLDMVSIRFTFSRLTYRTSHAGCAKAPENMKSTLLFPSPEDVASIAASPCARDDPYPSGQWLWANSNLNVKQKQAVQQVIRGSMRPLPYIIFGPPGTGKTMTIVETAYQLAKKCSLKILLVAPSNDAADVLVGRLAPYFPPSELRRPLAYSRPIETVAPTILPYVTEGGPDVREIVSNRTRIVVSTVNLAARFSFLGVDKGCFDVLIVDEAGHATEPEVVAVVASLMNFKKKAQVVLAGDPKQLGPIITSEICKSLGMSDSYLARLMARDIYMKHDGEFSSNLVTKLVENYRSHPAIIKLPNEMFYDNELVCSGDPLVTHNMIRWEHLAAAGKPFLFHAIDGDNLREANSPSWFNPQEAQQVVEYVRKLMIETRPPLLADDIGVITPYARQAQKIRLALESQGLRNVKVGSVETFQGQERRCIILSTVRSLADEVASDKRYNLGFVANEKRFNVAVTRAKALLIVIGCPRVLAMDEANWLPFLRYCHENGAWFGDEWDPEALPVAVEDDAADLGATDEASWDIVDQPSPGIEQEAFALTAREE